ncbi:hypothetical protein KEJ14_06280 [Candidatus Bathyarchaeota archaeon]|nr:hypothetical protein [Candidatus Bathyarchaeota archaeon]
MASEIKAGRKRKRSSRVEFSAVSVPLPLLKEIDALIEEVGYWPSRSAFVREACIEKIERERARLEKMK